MYGISELDRTVIRVCKYRRCFIVYQLVSQLFVWRETIAAYNHWHTSKGYYYGVNGPNGMMVYVLSVCVMQAGV